MEQEERYERVFLSTVLVSRYNEGEGYSLDDALREKGINPSDPSLEIIEKDDSDNSFIEYDVYRKVKVPVKAPIPPVTPIPPTKGGGEGGPTRDGGQGTPTRDGGPGTPTRDGGQGTPTRNIGQDGPTRGYKPETPTKTGGTGTPTRNGGEPVRGYKPETPTRRGVPHTPNTLRIRTRLEDFIGTDFELDTPDIDELEQDMLDKYYGNRAKEKEYQKAITRFKSHIVKKKLSTYNGDSITYYCVEDYPEYNSDARFLQLQEYSIRLERLSRAEAGDESLYQSTAWMYIESLRRSGSQEIPSMEEVIQILKMLDAEYIETNNYAYNQHVNTRENLKTLGKFGEKVPFLPRSKEKKASAKIGNVVRGVVNGTILLRNCSTALLHRLAGTYVVSPVHQLLINSEKSHSGLYKSKLTHRYEARKAYFEYLILKEYEEENERRKQNNEPLKKLNFLKLAFAPRFKSIFSSSNDKTRK